MFVHLYVKLKLVEYLHVQTGNPWYNYYVTTFNYVNYQRGVKKCASDIQKGAQLKESKSAKYILCFCRPETSIRFGVQKRSVVQTD